MDHIITVLIVEDDPLITRHYRRILAKDRRIRCVGSASNGYDGVMSAALYHPDVILMDIELEDKNAGLRATGEILSHLPDTKIIILTVCENDETVFKAFELGANNYLLKNMPAQTVIDAIVDAYSGNSVLYSGIAGKIKKEFRRIRADEEEIHQYLTPIIELTPAELEDIRLMLKGLTRNEICAKRHVEYSTLKSQIYSIMKKFHTDNMQNVLDIMKRLNVPGMTGEPEDGKA